MKSRFFLLVLGIFVGNDVFSKYLSLEELEQKGIHSYFDKKKQRLLLQGKNGHTAFLLPLGSHALVDGFFVDASQALVEKKQKYYIADRFVAEKLHNFYVENKKTEKTEKIISPKLNPSSKKNAVECVLGKSVNKVFLDPGHGGSDEGTTFHGIHEKDIVLDFSKKAAKELRKLGFEVSFSRTKDLFLPLDIRSELAKEWNADLFISIHINSSPARAANGTETYILSQEASDAEARKLALKENSIVQEISSKQSTVKDILWDMEQTVYLQASAYLASFLQKSIVNTADELLQKKYLKEEWKNRGVRQAPFFVLSRAAMPAVLLELGYLSNSKDRKLLTDKKFQESLAKALAQGVKMYKNACK